MRTVFLAGALAWPALLERVLGRASPVSGVPARLRDAAVGPWCEGVFPSLVLRDGAEAHGWLLTLEDDGDFARLSYFASAIGLAAVPKHILDAPGVEATVAFVAPEAGSRTPQTSWSVTDWAEVSGEMACDAATEILHFFPDTPSTDLGWRMPMILARAAARQAARAAPAPTELRSATEARSVEEVGMTVTHRGFFQTRVHHLRHPRFDGGMSEELRREIWVVNDAVILLPYDPVRDRVLLVEQFRMGPYGRGDPRPWALEPVAGRIDAGETPEAAARRECIEEAGLHLSRLEHITSHYCSPGNSTEFYHCFLGLTDLPDLAQGRGGLATEHEDIKTHVIGFDRALSLVETGEANIGPLVLMLLWLQRERPRLRASG